MSADVMQVWVGVDIGGTNTVIGLFDKDRNIMAKTTISTFEGQSTGLVRTNNPREFYDRLAKSIRTLAVKSNCDGRIVKVGIGVPGRIDMDRGIVEAASNLEWYDIPLAAEMSSRLGVPVLIENDVRAYALGEAIAGAGKGYRNIVCLTLGTGLAAGLIVDGRIVRGGRWNAGEIGHEPVEGIPYPCNCGNTGCLETVASATGIVRLAKEAVLAGEVTSLALGGSVHQLTALDVYRASMQGDPVACGIFNRVGTLLGRKLLSVLYILDPDIVIIGGGVAAAGEILLAPIRTVLENGYFSKKSSPPVCVGLLGDSAGLHGAIQLL